MKYNIYQPSEDLQDIVNQYVVLNSNEDVQDLLFLPNGCNFIVFNRGIKTSTYSFGGGDIVKMPKNYYVTAKTNKVKKLVIDLDTEDYKDYFPIIFVELSPAGFYKLFNMDASVISNKYMEIKKETAESYFSELYKHKNISEELAYLNSSLLKLKNSHCYTSNNSIFCIDDVIDRIENYYNFEVKVENLLSEFGCSRSTMERQFKKIIGLTPKNFIFISKFCRTLLEYLENNYTFHELQYIYSDNSHMNAVFQKFLGIPPSEIFAKVARGELYIYQLNNLKKLKTT
ncbi:AraC family transcriptional regulator [Candidatus Sulfurimonas baltica]|uniref:Helix-turn-helix transcriptional regulator n=1 Tax=Candidatus Sulfurimonas baltica TaxID=2740404 RepID=A0A7S7LV62_9BACT|nr:AraC family transcriptional regulator [Candidatus Sulfurimonas baltica]QOY52036.1 helix-turn-helix transcriptional regulator [Candidatus Sulfurimonas baltica]